MKRVIFVRHGQAVANERGLLAGALTNSPLTEKGEGEAKDLADKLFELETFDLIISSPLDRAYRTAEIIADILKYSSEIEIEPLFIERDFGNATNRPKAEAFAMLDNGTVIGAESISDFGIRADRALAWLRKRPEDHILIVSHAGFGQMLGTRAQGGDAGDFLKFNSLSNAGFFEFIIQ